MKMHTGESPLKCFFCERKFRYNSSRFRHMKKIHAGCTIPKPLVGEKPFKCHICEKGFRYSGVLDLHLRRSHKTPSPGEDFLKKRRKFKWPISIGKCAECGKVCGSKGHLQVHMRSHTKEKSFTCFFCDERFGYTSSRIKHMKRYHKGCIISKLKRYNANEFDCDLASKTKDVNLSVDKEPSAAGRDADFVGVASHSECDSSEDVKRFKTCEQSPLYFVGPKCTVYDQICASHSQLRQHIQGSHKGEKESLEVGVADCGFPSVSSPKLNLSPTTKHKSRTCQAILKCPLRGKVSRSRCHLEEHMGSNRREGPFKCTFCKKRFMCISSRIKHVYIWHRCRTILKSKKTEVKQFKYDDTLDGVTIYKESSVGDKDGDVSVCVIPRSAVTTSEILKISPRRNKSTSFDKGYSSKDNLEQHIHCHPREMSLHCSVCDERFGCNDGLVKHLNKCRKGCTMQKVQVDQNVVACKDSSDNNENGDARHPMNPASFTGINSSDMLNRLRKRDRSQTHQVEYECAECGNICSSTSRLRQHMRSHTKWKSFKCHLCDETFKCHSSRCKHIRVCHKRRTAQRVKKDGNMLFECDLGTQNNVVSIDRKPYEDNDDGNAPASSLIDDNASDLFKFSKRKISHNGRVIHKCPTCGKVCYAKSHLTEHMRSHTGETPFQCSFCDNRFKYSSSRDKHIKRWHIRLTVLKTESDGSIQSECDSVGEDVTVCKISKDDDGNGCVKNKFRTGRVIHECATCGKVCSSKSRLTEHIRSHTGEKPFKCSFCDKRFVFSSSRVKHIRRLHTGCTVPKLECNENEPLKCDSLDESMRMGKTSPEGDVGSECVKNKFQTGRVIHKCPTCGKVCTSKSHLTEHIRSHTGETPFQCSFCFKRFGYSSSRDRHIKRRHKELTVLKPESNGSIQSECDSVGEDVTVCKISKDDDGNGCVKNKFRTGRVIHECPTCGKVCSSKSHLTEHIRSHTGEKPFKCSFCDKRFVFSSSRVKHIRRLHTGCTVLKLESNENEPLKCDSLNESMRMGKTSPEGDVGDEYDQPVSAISSTEVTETLQKSDSSKPYPVGFKCTNCDKVCSSIANLKEHIRCHTNEKPFKCHRGEAHDGKPFKCELCEVKFTYLHTLERHMKTTHKEFPLVKVEGTSLDCNETRAVNGLGTLPLTDKKPLECCHCGKEFLQPGRLHRHVIMVHGDNFVDDQIMNSIKAIKARAKDVLSEVAKSKTNKVPVYPRCSECGKTFNRNSDFRFHIRTHTGELPFECYFCAKRFATTTHRNRHMKKIHKDSFVPKQDKNIEILRNTDLEIGSGEESLDCDCRSSTGEDRDRCGCVNAIKARARRVLQEVKSKQSNNVSVYPRCPECGKTFTSNSYFSVHIQLHTGELPFKCSFCDKSFRTTRCRRRHMVRVHKGCTVSKLDKSLVKYREDVLEKSKGNLGNNVEVETKVKPYEFDPGAIVRSYQEFKGKTVVDPKKFPCAKCGKVCRSQRNLKEHMRRHTGKKPLKCAFCDMRFRFSSCRGRHVKLCHQDWVIEYPDSISSDEKVFQYHCALCKVKFRYLYTLHSHIDMVHKGCPFGVGAGYNDDNLLNNHVETGIVEKFSGHESETGNICDSGQDSNERKLSKLDDKSDVGTREKCASSQEFKGETVVDPVKFTCMRSIKAIKARAAGVLSEVARSKKDKKPVKPSCSECGKTFSTNWGFRVHIRTHTGELPFECDFCAKRFVTTSKRNRHMKKIHKDSSISKRDRNIQRLRNTDLEIGSGEESLDCDCGSLTGEDRERCGCVNAIKTRARRVLQEVELANGKQSNDIPVYPKCPECGETFTRNGYFRNHIRFHTGELPFKCSFCDKSFRRAILLRRHMVSVHEGCTVSKLDNSLVGYQEDIEAENYGDVETKEKPSKFDSGIREKCDSGQASKEPKLSKLHDKSDVDPVKFKCLECDKICSSPYTLKEHMRRHTGEKPVKCAFCDMRFRYTSLLQRHVKLFHNEWLITKPDSVSSGQKAFRYQCALCKDQFTFLNQLNSHIDELHKHPVDKNAAEKVLKKRTEAKSSECESGTVPNCLDEEKRGDDGEHFKCDICNQTFGYRSNLSRHLRTMHAGFPQCMAMSEPEDGAIENFPKIVANPDGVVTEGFNDDEKVSISAMEHKCSACGIIFTSVNHLREHIMSHTQKKLIKCSICDLRFRYSTSIIRHFEKFHKGSYENLPQEKTLSLVDSIANYQNDIKARTEAAITEVINGRQQGDTESPLRFKCVECESSYASAFSLREHTRYHTGEQPLQCHFCEKTFKAKRVRLKHMKEVHGELTPLRYKKSRNSQECLCFVCGRMFGRKNRLNVHMRTHSGEKPYECDSCHVKFRHDSTLSKHIKIRNLRGGVCPNRALYNIRKAAGKHLALTVDNSSVNVRQESNAEEMSENYKTDVRVGNSVPPEIHATVDSVNYGTPAVLDNSVSYVNHPDIAVGFYKSPAIVDHPSNYENTAIVDNSVDYGTFVTVDNSMDYGAPVSVADSVNCGTPVTVHNSVNYGIPVTVDDSVNYGTPVTIDDSVNYGTPVTADDSINYGARAVVDNSVNCVTSVAVHNSMNYGIPVTEGNSVVNYGTPVSLDNSENYGAPAVVDNSMNYGPSNTMNHSVHYGMPAILDDSVNYGTSVTENSYSAAAIESNSVNFETPVAIDDAITYEGNATAGNIVNYNTATIIDHTRDYSVIAIIEPKDSQNEDDGPFINLEENHDNEFMAVSRKVPDGLSLYADEVTLHPENKDDKEKKTKKKYPCPQCFKGVANLSEHMRTHTGEKPYTCDYCDLTFKYTSSRLKHIKVIHKGCPRIRKPTSSGSGISKDKGDAMKRFNCLCCGKLFSQKHHLEDHVLCHTGEKPFECRFCEMSFRHLNTVVRHEKTFHQDCPVKEEVKRSVERGEISNKYQRRKMGVKKLPKAKKSSQHVGEELPRTSSNDVGVSEMKTVRELESLASENRSSVCAGLKHERGCPLRSMSSNVAVNFEDIEARTEAHIAQVVKRRQDGDKLEMMSSRLRCVVCGKKCGSIFDLREHTRRHTGQKPLKCLFCDVKFRYSNCRQRHMKLFHKGCAIPKAVKVHNRPVPYGTLEMTKATGKGTTNSL